MVHKRLCFDRFLLSSPRLWSKLKLRLAVIALLDQWAFIAFRILRTANLPAMPDKVDVKRVMLLRRDQFSHSFVRLFIAEALRNQPNSFCYSQNMYVHRKYFFITGEQQDAGRRLRADSSEGCKKFPGLLDWRCV